MQRLETVLKIHFALLSALGGLMLGIDNASGTLPVIAVAAAFFSLIAVDLLKLFALPPLAAYLGMAGVAAYCISDFVLIASQDNEQLVAVAQLLVLVLAVLQMQRKTRRVFEQIGVFCLLELVVAAVFNNALVFAALMIPFAALATSALVLLQMAAVAESAAGSGLAEPAPAGGTAPRVRTQAPAAAAELDAQRWWLPGLSLATLSPAIVLIAGTFFYGLPRTMQSASSSGGGGPAMVGFSETLRLKQLGRMLQDSTPVMRVRLFDRATDTPYFAREPLYLRGVVLDSYELAGATGIWRSMQVLKSRRTHRLPAEPLPPRRNDQRFFDSVDVEITTQPISTVALFAIAPYFATEHNPAIFHTVGNWTINRGDSTTEFDHRRMTYRFGTNAFYLGQATRYIRATGPDEHVYVLPRVITARPSDLQPFWLARLTQFDSELLPTVQQRADAVVAAMPPADRNPHAICLRFEEYLRRDAGLRYTLDLTHDRREDMDPLEQFLQIDRAGHCQFFASSLAMMLRSQGIPARLVVGYKSGEYNALGQQYVVRQSHAHAWVEALIDEDDLPADVVLHGQPAQGAVWLSMDPTPSGGHGVDHVARPVSHAFDFAQTIWERYVLDMDGEQQKSSLYGNLGSQRLAGSYAQMVDWGRRMVTRVRPDPVIGTPPADRHRMGLFLALLGGCAALGAAGWWYWRRPEWRETISRSGRRSEVGARPQVDFFAAAYAQLARVGLLRRPAQTPREFAVVAADRLRHASLPAMAPPLQLLTDAYYGVRFGAAPRGARQEEQIEQAMAQLTRAVEVITAERVDGR